jgi:hypothetical protein
MKKSPLLMVVMILAVSGTAAAQPFLQLVPRGLYKEDVTYTGADWAGFYRTSQYDEIGPSLMLLVPTGDRISGFCISADLRYVRVMWDGVIKGNGVTYQYATLDYKNKLKLNNPMGEGFMVMKDDGEKANVYCKHGHSKGISEQKGCFTAGKKKAVELQNGDRTADFDWAGEWNMEAKYEGAILKLEKFDYVYEGYYTLKNFQRSESKTSAWAMGFNKTKTTTFTFPESTVGIHGIPFGDHLYYLYLHKDGQVMGAGYFTMSPEKNAFSGPYIEYEKVKNLGEKGSTILKCSR